METSLSWKIQAHLNDQFALHAARPAKHVFEVRCVCERVSEV